MDNSRLNYLLDLHAEDRSAENYRRVLDEIQNGNSSRELAWVHGHIYLSGSRA